MTKHKRKPKGRGFYYDRKGKRIDLWKWAELSEDPKYTCLRDDEVGGLWISTIWIGINLYGSGFEDAGTGFETMFETCVFERPPASKGRPKRVGDLGRVVERRRWVTEAEAIAGHELVCEEFRK